jgi:hypothetical protein
MSNQLLINHNFDEGNSGWTASGGFGTYSHTSSNQIAVLDGVAYFTYVSRTLSQVVNVSDLVENTSHFICILNIRHRQKGDDGGYTQVDTYSFEVLFKDSSNNMVASKRTPSSGVTQAPKDFTDIELRLDRTEIPNSFNSISSIEVKVTGLDVGYWNGNHGPMVDYISLFSHKCHNESNLILYHDPSNTNSYPGSGSSVYDLSGNGLDGLASNLSYSYPYFNFNGTNSQIEILDNSLLEPGSGDWTMEAWLRVTSNQSGVILGKFEDGGRSEDVSYSIRINSSGSLFAQLGSGINGEYVNSTSYQTSTNIWYHVIYVWKNGGTKTLETYINGTSIGSVNHSLNSLLDTPNNLYIGSYNNGEYNQYFNGRIGAIRLYNSAFTSEEVTQNYNCGTSFFFDPTPTSTPTPSPTPTPTYNSNELGLRSPNSNHWKLNKGIKKRQWNIFRDIRNP